MLTSTFESLVREVLSTLHNRIGFDLWMVTRTSQEDWIILLASDHSYNNITEGTVFRWADSLCYQMVLGNGPSIAPQISDVNAYIIAPLNQQLRIGAYAGVPLVLKNGALFGTLCAIHATSLPESVKDDLPLLITISKLLSEIIDNQLQAADQVMQLKKAEQKLLEDAVTGSFNKRTWDRLLVEKEASCRCLGHSASIIVIGLDTLHYVAETEGQAAANAYLHKAAQAIQRSLPLQVTHYTARIDEDTFAVLCLENTGELGARITDILMAQLRRCKVDVSIGIAIRKPHIGLREAWQEAELAMTAHRNEKTAAP